MFDLIIDILLDSSNERILGRYAKIKVILEEITRNSTTESEKDLES